MLIQYLGLMLRQILRNKWQYHLFTIIMLVFGLHETNFQKSFLWNLNLTTIYDIWKWVVFSQHPSPYILFYIHLVSLSAWWSSIYVKNFHLKDHVSLNVSLNVFFLFILVLTHVISPLIWHHLTAHYTSMIWSVNIYNVHVIFIF